MDVKLDPLILPSCADHGSSSDSDADDFVLFVSSARAAPLLLVEPPPNDASSVDGHPLGGASASPLLLPLEGWGEPGAAACAIGYSHCDGGAHQPSTQANPEETGTVVECGGGGKEQPVSIQAKEAAPPPASPAAQLLVVPAAANVDASQHPPQLQQQQQQPSSSAALLMEQRQRRSLRELAMVRLQLPPLDVCDLDDLLARLEAGLVGVNGQAVEPRHRG
jgi:hypothetical protein